MKRLIFSMAFLALNIHVFGQMFFDSPVTYFYEETKYKSDGETKIGSYDGTYFMFKSAILNKYIYEVYSNGSPKDFNGGYIYKGTKDGYDYYVSFYTFTVYYPMRRVLLNEQNYRYLLVSKDKKTIYKHFHMDYINSVSTYEKGDPNNRRRKPRNSPPSNNIPYTPSNPIPQKERETRTITCSRCNGTGLDYDNSSPFYRCGDDCDHSAYCSMCGRTHCLKHCKHINCYLCDGKGKIHQHNDGRGWYND